MITALSVAIERLLNYHLHGSGWDYPWEVSSLKNGKFLCTTSFHPMDDAGMYDSPFDVKVTLQGDLEIARICFHADSDIRKNYICGQEEFYYDSVYQALKQVNIDLNDALDSAQGKFRPA